MANLALIRGAADVAPKFTDIRGAVEPGIQTFKNIQALRQKEADEDEAQRKREDQIKFNLYANLPGLEEDLIPDKFKGPATQKALEIRKQQKALIDNKNNMDQYEFIDQMNELNKQVSNINKDFNAYKEWSANWVDLKSTNDLSSGMSANDRKQILDVLQGNGEPVFDENGIGIKLDSGEIKYLKNLPNVIPIAYDKHRDISNQTLKIAEKLGASGIASDNPVYKDRMDLIIGDFKRGMSDQDALSLGADFLKLGGAQGEMAGIIKNIIEDPKLIENTLFDDRDEFGNIIGKIKGMDGYKEFIADQYAQIARNSNDAMKKIYDDALAAKNNTKPTPIDPSIAKGFKLGQSLLNDPVSRFREVVNLPSSYNKKTGIFSYEETLEDGDEIITRKEEYNLNDPSDIIRLARQILENEGVTAADKTKQLDGLKLALEQAKQQQKSNQNNNNDNDDSDFSQFKIGFSTADIEQTQNEIAMAQLNKKTNINSARNKLLKEQFREQTKSTIQ